jgi:hypothetical protein
MTVQEMHNSTSYQPSYRLITQRSIAIAAIVLFLGFSLNVQAYSVLTHEAIIDSAWHIKIRPLLLERFPNATKDELRQAHAFAYGGAIIQDLGYYPHGSRFFSDLVHYVRSGDFILALLRDSQDLNEYAFALGALAHYAADDNGHRLAVNRTVPLLYPHLGKKYGSIVTYEDNPAAHLKTEFGFDVLQVARGRYAPDSYHDFIGFEVARPLLERAFQETYSLPLPSVFDDLDKAIGSYRYTVHSVIPKATKGEISRLLDYADPQDRPAQGPDFPRANAPGREDVRGQLQRRTRGLSASLGRATNGAPGPSQPQLRHWQPDFARHLLHGRPDLCSSAGPFVEGSVQTDFRRATREYPRLLQRFECAGCHKEESQGLGAGHERIRRTEIRAFAAADLGCQAYQLKREAKILPLGWPLLSAAKPPQERFTWPPGGHRDR